MRFTTTLACMMDLHYYPLDSQNCSVEIESCEFPIDLSRFLSFPSLFTYDFVCFLALDGYTVSDVDMYWKPTPVHGVNDAELPQFTILGYETNDRKVKQVHVL